MKKIEKLIAVFTNSFTTTYPPMKYPESEHCDGTRFFNQDRTKHVKKGFSQLLKWLFAGGKKTWPSFIADNVEPNFTSALERGQSAITLINHATVFIQIANTNVITDPIFSNRASPTQWLGPKRHRSVGAKLSDLPKIHVVLISHNHYDHLDINSLIAINAKDHPLFLVPLGNKKLLSDAGIEHVIELDWWEHVKLENQLVITFVPMQHWSGRGIHDRCATLWGGFIINSQQQKILFAGDTGYHSHFKEIEHKFGPMDASLLPIGAYEPRWFMQDSHMNPEEAVKAHLDLKSKISIGIHFGTFQLTNEGADDPVIDLKASLQSNHISENDFIAPKNGQTILLNKII